MNKRIITRIVVHCTATSPDASIKSIKDYWVYTKKWNTPGYHLLVDQFGIVHLLHNLDLPSNGAAGYNKNSIHIAYIGGVINGIPTDTRTVAQRQALLLQLRKLRSLYPHAAILGHRDLPKVAKACPSFNAKDEYDSI